MSEFRAKPSKVHNDRASIVIGGAIIAVLGIAAAGGGAMFMREQQNAADSAGDTTNSIGHASYPLEDGKTCRDVEFNLANGNIIKSTTRSCKKDPVLQPHRGFIWNR